MAVSADGSGLSHPGNLSDLDSDNVRAVRHGEMRVQRDTDAYPSIGHGSDGSLAFVMTHAR